MGKMVKVSCGECSKLLTFTNLKRHMKTVHDRDIGKRWTYQNCGKASQSEKRLIQHQNFTDLVLVTIVTIRRYSVVVIVTIAR